MTRRNVPSTANRIGSVDLGPSLPVSFRKLKREIAGAGTAQNRILIEVARKLGMSRSVFYQAVQEDTKAWYPEAVLDSVLRIIDGANGRVNARAADPRKRRACLFPDEYTATTLRSGNAERGEIEIVVQSGRNLIDPELHAGVAPYVAVYVDQVRFFQRNKLTGERFVAPGQYVRIEIPKNKDGAVSLPVCVDSQEVMLVAQFRHPQRKFIVEAPRGFANAVLDKGPADTAKRETQEETGLVVEDIRQIPLRALYTDTGKFAEKPCYFLQLVDREAFQRDFLLRSGVMQAPAWIPLNDFYEAVFAQDPVPLTRELFDEAFLRENRAWLDGLTELDEYRLHIEDVFTVTAALLAIPHLIPRLPRLPCWSRFQSPQSTRDTG